ncbi:MULTISPECIES: MerR family transcriptional regulator [Virgibacillus]|uniref:HTH-type transcriptional regulator AdhR n=2 Tax=Virgibacillus TaxID=84406 RepID=A0A024QHE1_9BACI|nr:MULTISPECIES: MerR family transcriptional regulator [Virgibacillus]EQB34540.1 hypothetical protein M948_20995 [Virgibacillus sp. CM-4]MYL43721.1 MerR family transcriptional regulator [Virgibacillus massiliensis]GGJ76701.1 MerR family transcriptional regulator [Virgibacillus kapii]CDQ41366.1 HTH-type transcriptional regulator AdhR [Virgibacillus massiliensis]
MTYYSINEISEMTNLSPSTLRYYEKEGLIPVIERDKNGVRVYNETNLECIQFIMVLRSTNMPIIDIKQYVKLFHQGEETIHHRKELIQSHKEKVEIEIAERKKYLQRIECTLDYYEAMERRSRRMKSS